MWGSKATFNSVLLASVLSVALSACFPSEQRGDRVIATYTFNPPTDNPIVQDVAVGAAVPLDYAGVDTGHFSHVLTLEADCTEQYNGRYCPAQPQLNWKSSLSESDQSFLGYWQVIGRLVINVADSYAARGEFEKARQAYRGALDIFEPLNRLGLGDEAQYLTALDGYTEVNASQNSSSNKDGEAFDEVDEAIHSAEENAEQEAAEQDVQEALDILEQVDCNSEENVDLPECL